MSNYRATLRRHHAFRRLEPRIVTAETRNRCAAAIATHGERLTEDENKLLLDLVVRHSLEVPVPKKTLDAAMGLLGSLGAGSRL